MTAFAAQERTALADLMESLGPDAATLCAGWTTRDLAAHLVTRSHRLDAAPGIVIPALAKHTKKVTDQVATQQWSALVEKVRAVPWWVTAVDEPLNRVEYFVHHEDVRRAQPDWQPRQLSPEFSAALWSRVHGQAKLALRKTPAAVTVTAPGFGSVSAGKGGPDVGLVGAPAELMLFLLGRQARAQVELTGPAQIIDRMRTARYGI